MDVPSMEALAARIDRLERENAWLKRVGAASLVGLLALVALGTDAVRRSREVSADSFVLKDAQGRPRAALSIRPDGPGLRFLDAEGRDQVALRAGDDGSSILEFFEGPALKAALAHQVGSGASLSLPHRGSRGAAGMFMMVDGSSGFALNRGRRGVGINVARDGTAKLSFLDRAGEEHAGMALSPEGSLTGPGPLAAPPDDATRVTHAPEAAPARVPAARPAEVEAEAGIEAKVEVDGQSSRCEPAPSRAGGAPTSRTFGSP